MSPVCYDCNRRTKSELEDENKTNTFFQWMFSKFIWWRKVKNKETENILLWLYRLNNFLLLFYSSSFVIACFVYFLETY